MPNHVGQSWKTCNYALVLSQCLDILFEICLKLNSVALHTLLIQMLSYAVFTMDHKRFTNQALMLCQFFRPVVPPTGLFRQLIPLFSYLLHEVFFQCVSAVVASKVGHQQFLVVNDRSPTEEALVTLHFELPKGQLVVRDICLVPDVQAASKGVARGGAVVKQ